MATQAVADHHVAEPGRRPAAAVAPVRDIRVSVRDVELACRQWGRDEAPAVLVLHGLTGHAWEFDHVASALADRFRVLAVHQRGHGASAWAGSYSPAAMADDAAALAEALAPGPVDVIGHSMGGVNGWWLASRHPGLVRRLVVLDIDPAVLCADATVQGWKAVLATNATAVFEDPGQAVAEYLRGYAGSRAQEQGEFVRNNLRRLPTGGWTWRYDALRLWEWMECAGRDEAAHWKALRGLGCPTLVVNAADSPYTSLDVARRMAAEIPQAKLVEIPDAGHDVHIDQREALVAQVRAFLPEGRSDSDGAR